MVDGSIFHLCLMVLIGLDDEIVELEEGYFLGTGMCGGCRVTVGGKIRYACVDGPDFDGHQVDFEELMRRNGTYREQEQHVCRLHREGGAQ